MRILLSKAPEEEQWKGWLSSRDSLLSNVIFSSAEILPLHGKPRPMATLAYWSTGIKQLASSAKSFLFTLYVIIRMFAFLL